MTRPGWHRIAARVVLLTFTSCFVACGGAESPPPTTTSTTAVVPTTLPPAPPPTEPPAPPPTQPPPPPTLPAQPPEQLNKQQLRDLVAPVALYPDVVLASLLPATTNADQIHDAAQYVGQAQHVDQIPQDRGWDGSVVGLLQFPDVLRWLDQNPAWTDEMGQAVTYQQGDVLQAIQDYRHAVNDVGNLKSNQYQTVHADPGQDIRIEPAHPDVVYVPSYDPALAVQPQPAQPAPGINPWLAFGGGAVVGALGAWALYSIFDSDHGNHVTNNYYGGGGRRIRAYDNYYYARGRRPQQVEWTPRQRERRAPVAGWEHPRRLEHRAQAGQATRAAAPLRPPTKATTTQAPSPRQLRREQQQEMRQQRQEQQLQNRQQRQEQQRQNRAQRQEQKQQKRQQPQMQRQERQQEQRDQREQRQQNREQQRQQQQQNREQQRQERQQRQEQQQQQRQQERQERQGQRKEQRQERQQQQGGGQNKKKKKQQQQEQ